MAVFRLTAERPETQRRTLYPDHEEGSACHGGIRNPRRWRYEPSASPAWRWDFGKTGEAGAARFQMNEEQDVVRGETSPCQHFEGEEVGTCQDGHVTGDEILPGGILAPLSCRLDPVPAKDIARRLIGNGVAEIGQGSDDAVVSPAGILSGEAHNERFQFGRERGRPGEVRSAEPSKLRAMSRRYQARMVSGLATQPTC